MASWPLVMELQHRARKTIVKGKAREGLEWPWYLQGQMLRHKPCEASLSWEAHIKVIVVGLEAANAILLSPLCVNPMLSLKATLAIFKATLDSDFMVPKDKVQVRRLPY